MRAALALRFCNLRAAVGVVGVKDRGAPHLARVVLLKASRGVDGAAVVPDGHVAHLPMMPVRIYILYTIYICVCTYIYYISYTRTCHVHVYIMYMHVHNALRYMYHAPATATSPQSGGSSQMAAGFAARPHYRPLPPLR